MSASWPLPAVFGSAIVYTIAALCAKRALAARATVWQVNFAANMAMALLYLPLWAGADLAKVMAQGYKPLLASVTFFVGQLFTFAALRKGDVSVATPLLGAKVLFVALLNSVVFGETVPMKWWVAAFVCTAGIFLVTGIQKKHAAWSRHSRITAAYSLIAAIAYALTDILLQHWSAETGVINFVAVMFTVTGILTCALYIPAAGLPALIFPPPAARTILFGGSVLLALQNFVVTMAIRFSGDATAVNVVYSSRCVLSVVLAWATARWLGSREATLPRSVLLLRLAGALLLAAAILMVLA
jgi:drug/metabolite transporter (DMT)-like permease